MSKIWRAAIALLVAVCTPLALAPAAGAQESKPQLLLLLDSSGSMAEADASGTPKIEAARRALGTVVDRVGAPERVGMRVFGATAAPNTPPACTDTQLVVPIGADNRADLRAAVGRFQPRGDTPIAYALREGGRDLGTAGKRTILLVSDGIATCDLDPCAAAAELAGQGIDVMINVVGFRVDAAARGQLRCIAAAGRGTYFDAHDAVSLTAALDRVATRAFRPFTVTGTPVGGTAGPDGAPELRPGGQYTDTAAAKGQKKHYQVTRQLTGSSIHVGISTVPGQRGQLGLKINSRSGATCGFDYDETSGGNTAWTLVTAQVTAWPKNDNKNDPCRDDRTLVVTVEVTDWSSEIQGLGYEMVVREEPAVTNADALPAKQSDLDIGWQPMPVTAGGPEEVVGGASFADAPVLRPGSYRTDVLPGETVLFRVGVDWGQQAQVQADFPQPSPQVAKALDVVQHARLYVTSPLRGDVTPTRLDGTALSYSGLVSRDRPSTLATASPVVRWNNRAAVNAPQHANLPGEYYVAIAMAGRPEGGESVAIPLVLTVGVTGAPGQGAPQYRDGGPPLSPSSTANPTGPGGTAADAQRPAGGVSPLLIGGLAVVGAGLIGAGLFGVRRWRKS